ncbi:glycosyltransferase family 39 protein [Ruegeria arenilitoris]|uniref:glycosyltransferase family 39 protein n=1 Tax=Ruegeria arenilitoris TaxID=1173585 RepID=UPI00147F80D6|nr:glycosyltransferase family 39 protein [Ruegeria arenilitoris]
MTSDFQTRISQLFLPSLIFLTLVGAALRIYLAMSSTYLWDEHRDWIPEALAISFDPANLNLPIRTQKHGALVAYFFKLGSIPFPDGHIEMRWTSVLAGTLTIPIIGLIGRKMAGALTGVLAAAILALNEFHISVSAIAIQMAWYMFFSALSIMFFLRFLEGTRQRDIVLAAFWAGLAFLTYEITALMILAMAIWLLIHSGFGVLTKRSTWIALLVGGLLIFPDIYTNFFTESQQRDDYGTLLNRVGSLGFNPQYFAFFIRAPMEVLYPLILGRDFVDGAGEYKSMNAFIGLLMGGAVLIWLAALTGALKLSLPRHLGFMLTLFLTVFGIFTLIEVPRSEDVALWLWVAVILIPGSVLLAALVAEAGRFSIPISLALLVGLLISPVDLWQTNFYYSMRQALASPELLTGPEGSKAQVDVYLDLCDLCEKDITIELVDVTYQPAANAPAVSALETGEAEVVTSTGDTPRITVLVKSDEDNGLWMARIYQARLDLWHEDEFIDTIYALSRVPYKRQLVWPPVFWIPQDNNEDSVTSLGY